MSPCQVTICCAFASNISLTKLSEHHRKSVNAPVFDVLAVTQADDIYDVNSDRPVGGRNTHDFPAMCTVKSLLRRHLVALGNLVVYVYFQIGESRSQNPVKSR